MSNSNNVVGVKGAVGNGEDGEHEVVCPSPAYVSRSDWPQPDTRVLTDAGVIIPYREALEWDHSR